MTKIECLLQKGVQIPNPSSVHVDENVDVGRISKDVVLHPGSQLFGHQTYIAAQARIGFEGPVTIENCYVGPRVSLKGGFFSGAVFLDGASCGSGSHVREGTILEEQASIAHTVGLKQTILFPYVTLGSLINFCDCFMAGGTDRKNHSEVGSSYIHFNYTPNQDKATPSLMGDVPRGVMLNQTPIFLGGQGGLVGPCRLAYGTVVAAGAICRKDQLKENYLVIEGTPQTARIPYKTGGYQNLGRIWNHNTLYIGQLLALNQWYREVRSLFVGSDFAPELLAGLHLTLKKGIAERVKQLDRLVSKVLTDPGTVDGRSTIRFFDRWEQTKASVEAAYSFEGTKKDKDSFLTIVEQKIGELGKNYVRTIKSFGTEQAECGQRWLQSIVDHVVESTRPKGD